MRWRACASTAAICSRAAASASLRRCRPDSRSASSSLRAAAWISSIFARVESFALSRSLRASRSAASTCWRSDCSISLMRDRPDDSAASIAICVACSAPASASRTARAVSSLLSIIARSRPSAKPFSMPARYADSTAWLVLASTSRVFSSAAATCVAAAARAASRADSAARSLSACVLAMNSSNAARTWRFSSSCMPCVGVLAAVVSTLPAGAGLSGLASELMSKYSAEGGGRIMGGRHLQVKAVKRNNFNGQNSLTSWHSRPTMKELSSGHVAANLIYGGDTASTGVKTRGMHAELH